MMVELGLVGRLKHFLGLFNQTEFESRLIDQLRSALDSDVRSALDDQLARFNRVQRLLADDPRLDCGSTMFYWIRHGKSMIADFPIRIRGLREFTEKVFARCVVEDSEMNLIQVDFVAVHGVFVLLKYYSINRIWYPKGNYVIKQIENLVPGQ